MPALIVRLLVGLTAAAMLIAALVAVNGLLAPGESPVLGRTGHPPRALKEDAGGVEVRVVAYNIAKAFAYRQRLRFADPVGPEQAQARLEMEGRDRRG